MIIAIDGPAGSGKSSTAREVARRLGVVHLDTGAMYRAITLKCLREGIAHTDNTRLADLVGRTELRFTGSPPDTRIWMDGEDVSAEIRGDRVTSTVSDYCAPAVVRAAMVDQQRSIGRQAACVCEGRDIGTDVFPEADLKIFMVASVEQRALRRQRDFEKAGVTKTVAELVAEIGERDRKDSTRALAPLTRAADAEQLDTTDLGFEQQVEYIVSRAKQIRH